MKSGGKPSHSKAAARDVNADRVKRRGVRVLRQPRCFRGLRRTKLLFSLKLTLNNS